MNNEIKYISEHYTEFEPKCPIVIPSYKCRNNTVLNNLKSLSNNKIMLFIYDTDYDLYKQFEDEQIEVIQIHETWRSLRKKRHWIQQYLVNRLDIENYIMIDDDLKKAKITCYKDNGKVTSKYIPLINAFGILEYLHKKYSNTVSGCVNCPMGILNDKSLYKQQTMYQLFCVNNKLIRDNPQCMFRDIDYVSEDQVVWFDLFNNKIPYYAFQSIYFEFDNIRNNKSYQSIASDSLKRNVINALRIMKDKCVLSYTSEWKCWSVRFKPNYIERKFIVVKDVLDNNMPNWEDITVDYSDAIFNKVFNEIDKLLAKDNNTELDKFLS